jgi:hypothetical protein
MPSILPSPALSGRDQGNGALHASNYRLRRAAAVIAATPLRPRAWAIRSGPAGAAATPRVLDLSGSPG